MAVSEPPALASTTLTAADVPAALALSDAAGWNQTAEDWGLFVARGHAIGLRAADAALAATATALPYDGGLGWISMVLVRPDVRHRGLATRLIDDCVRFLQGVAATPVLDATPAGAEVYRRIGFVPGFALERWQRGARLPSGLPGDAAVRSAGLADLDVIVALDRDANRLGRHFLLEAFLRRRGTRAWLQREGGGFVLARVGRRAVQLGPLVAADAAGALALLATALAAEHGPVFLDVPTRWSAVTRWLQGQGFERQRGFVRMALGSAEVLAASDRLFVLAGPEFG
jgi:GNAT superfamily N-acetyltransferase